MASSIIQLPADGAGKKLNTRERTIGANSVHDQIVIPVPDRVVTNTGLVTVFRTLGNALTTQSIFSIENASGSAVLVGVRRLTVQMDATAVLITQVAQIKAFRISAGVSGGGTTLTKGQRHTTDAASASVVCRGATASDGGAATAITGTLDVAAIWQQYGMRLHTAVGQVLTPDNTVLPDICQDEPLILRANQAIVVQVQGVVTTGNPATNHWLVNCVWDEFTLP